MKKTFPKKTILALIAIVIIGVIICVSLFAFNRNERIDLWENNKEDLLMPTQDIIPERYYWYEIYDNVVNDATMTEYQTIQLNHLLKKDPTAHKDLSVKLADTNISRVLIKYRSDRYMMKEGNALHAVKPNGDFIALIDIMYDNGFASNFFEASPEERLAEGLITFNTATMEGMYFPPERINEMYPLMTPTTNLSYIGRNKETNTIVAIDCANLDELKKLLDDIIFLNGEVGEIANIDIDNLAFYEEQNVTPALVTSETPAIFLFRNSEKYTADSIKNGVIINNAITAISGYSSEINHQFNAIASESSKVAVYRDEDFEGFVIYGDDIKFFGWNVLNSLTVRIDGMTDAEEVSEILDQIIVKRRAYQLTDRLYFRDGVAASQENLLVEASSIIYSIVRPQEMQDLLSQYIVDGNVSTYVAMDDISCMPYAYKQSVYQGDPNGECFTYNVACRTLKNKLFNVAGNLRGITITLKPVKIDDRYSYYYFEDAIINAFIHQESDRVLKEEKTPTAHAYEEPDYKAHGTLGTMLDHTLLDYLTRAFGGPIAIESELYRNSEITFFIYMPDYEGSDMKVYAQFGGLGIRE